MTTWHTAIVTGANHGIGAATARALARSGCAVIARALAADPHYSLAAVIPNSNNTVRQYLWVKTRQRRPSRKSILMDLSG